MSKWLQAKYFKEYVKDYKFWFKLIIGTVQLTSIIIFLIANFIQNKSIKSFIVNILYFTTISNFFSAIFFIHSAIFHVQEGKGKFNNSEIGKIIMIFLVITIASYNIWHFSGDPSFQDWKYIMTYVCEHSIVPLLAIIYYLVLFNHENAKSFKEYNKTNYWYTISILLGYTFLFVGFGELGKHFHWPAIFEDRTGNPGYFIYPFYDFHNGVGVLNIKPWIECSLIILLLIIAVSVLAEFYTFITNINKKRIKKRKLNKSFQK